MKNLNELKNKKICILGLGVENYALVKFLLGSKKSDFGGEAKSDFSGCEITICDRRSRKN
jgi:hypothetical protein